MKTQPPLASLTIYLLLFAFFDSHAATRGPASVDVADPVVATAQVRPSTVEAGGTVDLVIQMNLHEHYHAYLERFKLTIESPDDLKLGSFKIDPIVQFHDAVSKTDKQGVSGHAKLRALVEVPVGFAAGVQTLALKLTYQACTDDHCLFPKSVRLSVPLTVRGSIVRHAED